MIIRQTLPHEAGQVNTLFSVAFDTPLSDCSADPKNPKIRHWAAFEDDNETMMSTLSVSDYQIQFDGHSCKMGGIGGVATPPAYRRRGGIRGCFQVALPQMFADGYDFSYLYPFSTAYYRKFGYETCVQKFRWTVDLALLNPPAAAGFFRMADKNAPMAEEIAAVDAVWENRYNMTVRHTPEDYDWARKTDPAKTLEFTYVCFDGENRPIAYTTFKTANEPDGRNLGCSRLCFADSRGFFLLMQLFKTMCADYRFVKFFTPADPALQYLMPEWSLSAAKWELTASCGMVRAVNVLSILKKARYIGDGHLILAISDKQIPENNGTFSLEFAGGKAISAEKSEQSPDISMDVAAFSALIAGVLDFDSARQVFSHMEVRRESSARQVFYRKPLMIADYF